MIELTQCQWTWLLVPKQRSRGLIVLAKVIQSVAICGSSILVSSQLNHVIQ